MLESMYYTCDLLFLQSDKKFPSNYIYEIFSEFEIERLKSIVKCEIVKKLIKIVYCVSLLLLMSYVPLDYKFMVF